MSEFCSGCCCWPRRRLRSLPSSIAPATRTPKHPPPTRVRLCPAGLPSLRAPDCPRCLRRPRRPPPPWCHRCRRPGRHPPRHCRRLRRSPGGHPQCRRPCPGSPAALPGPGAGHRAARHAGRHPRRLGPELGSLARRAAGLAARSGPARAYRSCQTRRYPKPRCRSSHVLEHCRSGHCRSIRFPLDPAPPVPGPISVGVLPGLPGRRHAAALPPAAMVVPEPTPSRFEPVHAGGLFAVFDVSSAPARAPPLGAPLRPCGGSGTPHSSRGDPAGSPPPGDDLAARRAGVLADARVLRVDVDPRSGPSP